MGNTSFYTGDSTSYTQQNPTTQEGTEGTNTAAPSSFYPDGEIYEEISTNIDDAETAATEAADSATAAANSAANAAAALAAMASANPSAQVGLTAIDGSSTNFMRADAAPALNVGIAPTWTGAHTWSSSATFNGSVTFANPPSGSGASLTNLNASNLATGTVPAARLPAPTSSTLGGIKSNSGTTHQWVATINTDGSVTLSQPAFGDLSGNISVSQMASGSGASSTTFWRGDGTWATPVGGVTSVFGRTGAVVAVSGDYSFSLINGTAQISQGGTGQTTALAARSNVGLNIESTTFVGDTNYTMLATDRFVWSSASFTAARTWTLPLASSVNEGARLIIGPWGIGTFALTIACQGSDVCWVPGVNNVASMTFTVAGMLEFVSVGSQWAYIGTVQYGSLFSSPDFAAGLVPVSGGGTTNFLRADGTWAPAGAPTLTVTTYQSFTSSGTYTPRSGVTWIKVRMCGGGGGGGAQVTNSGSTGGTTTFATSTSWTAIGGSGGTKGGANNNSPGGAGGTGGANGTGTLIARFPGGSGTGGAFVASTASAGYGAAGGGGGSNPFGGAGGGAGNGTSGFAGAANTGAGGGGGSGTTANGAAGGGGAGEYVEFVVTSPSATTVTIGGSGAGGSGSIAGGAGAAGIILVEEHYY